MVTHTMSMVVVVSLGAGVLAGWTERPSAAAEASQEAGQALQGAEDMWAHFDRAEEIRHAVIVGDMEQVAEPAGWLEANLLSRELPAGSRDYIREIGEQAGEILEAGDIPAVAAGLGRMGEACSGCHQAKALGPEPYDANPVQPSRDIVGHMDRHLWASNQLWVGLITPSEKAWMEGAGALSDEPLGAHELPSVIAYDLVPIAERLHELGDLAAQATEPAERGRLYGQLIAACGECHTAVWENRVESE